MSALAAVTASRLRPAQLVIANRTLKALNDWRHRAGGTAAALVDLASQLEAADLVISCTGATGFVITEEMLAAVLAAAGPAQPLVLLDLAVPRDVEPDARRCPG